MDASSPTQLELTKQLEVLKMNYKKRYPMRIYSAVELAQIRRHWETFTLTVI
jgi:hypothetical protein